jgi:hypothetical protein
MRAPLEEQEGGSASLWVMAHVEMIVLLELAGFWHQWEVCLIVHVEMPFLLLAVLVVPGSVTSLVLYF